MRILQAFALTVAALAAFLPAVGCSRGGATSPSERKASPWLSEKTAKAKGNGPTTPEQDAILRVFDADQNEFKGGFDSMKANSQPSAVRAMVGKYADHLDKVDVVGCPAEFAAAHARHAKAWHQLQSSILRLPDAYEGDEFMNSLYSLFHNDGSNGRSLGGDVIQAVKKVNATYAEIYASGENYGLSFETK